jgi:hypothetical protein
VQTKVAFKRLSAVEVSPSASHQHELHADSLKRELGYGEGRTSGRLSVGVYWGDESDHSLIAEGKYTIYDARANHPRRSEYRLYYDTPAMARAAAGDLLVVQRSGDELVMLVAAAGSRVERELLAALHEGPAAVGERFRFLASPHLGRSTAGTVAEVLSAAPSVTPEYVEAMAAELAGLGDTTRLPNSEWMAARATEARERVHGEEGPDLDLFHGLEAETAIYFDIERRVQSRRLEELQSQGADLTTITAFIMSTLQSRRSRRGRSLQNHFAILLRREAVPFSEECETEPGERVDFVVPSCQKYHDLSFPAARLRSIGCKTTARERWRQLLNEARRVPERWLLTFDSELTSETIASITAAGIRIFLPAPIIAASYRANDRSYLGTIQEMVHELHAVS